MLLALLMAAAVSAPAGSPPTPPGLHTNPDWLKKPTIEELLAVWPVRALREGVNGKAEVSCIVNVHGLLEQCAIVSESPSGMDFGAAALLLTPSFLMKPASGPDGPVPARANIPINFKTNGPQGRSGGRDMLSQSLVLRAVNWTTAPTFADVERVYPARGGGAKGYVSLRCHVSADGVVRDCLTMEENPRGNGFDGAARSLTARFHANLSEAIRKSPDPIWVNIPVRLPPPDDPDLRNRHIGEPVWAVELDPAKMARLYPTAAADKGVKTGRGVAECVVRIDGSLADCKPAPGEPDGLGFSEAAVQVVEVMRMAPWTQEGGPVDGADVRIPVRFNLPPATAAPTAPASR